MVRNVFSCEKNEDRIQDYFIPIITDEGISKAYTYVSIIDSQKLTWIYEKGGLNPVGHLVTPNQVTEIFTTPTLSPKVPAALHSGLLLFFGSFYCN